jgi:hypothetical protein
MRYAKLGLTSLLVFALLTPPVQARSNTLRTVLGAAAVIGVASALSNRNRNRGYANNPYYGGSYPGAYGYGSSYPGAYGYRGAYGAPVQSYGQSYGASSYVDEGEYRNYRDAYGNYLGRVHLSQVY